MAGETVQRRVAGRYELTGTLGRGGMGVVWRARDALLRREVAVKQVELPPALSEEERRSLRARVLREAQAAARLAHPGSVTVFDVVEEDGNIYIVMELVSTTTLATLVEEHGPLSPRRTAQVGLELLAALEAAHRQGIVHRDVKPANVMVLPGGSVKLTDFGIASIRDHPSLTMTGQVFGSPSYMPPEQAQGHRSGPAADLWGLGSTLYYAVEGRPPFEREGAIPTLTAVVNEDPPEAQRAGPLAPTIRALLAKDPAARPPINLVRQELRSAAEGRPAEATAVFAPVTPSPPGGDALAPPVPGPAPEPVTTPVAEPRAAPVAEPRAVPVAEPEAAPPAEQPPPPTPTAPGPPLSRGLVAAVALAIVAVLGTLAWVGAGEDGGGDDDEAVRPEPSTTTSTAVTTTTTEARQRPVQRAATPAAAGVPDDWVRYDEPEGRYRIAHPPDWSVQRLDRTRTDIRAPGTGAYLRVDWTDTPGPSPEGAWEQQSKRFAATHQGYQEIRIEPTTYKGYDAAIWEYAYSAGGTRLHGVDLGFVTGRYGFALNFQTPEPIWQDSQPTFEAFKAGFEPST